MSAADRELYKKLQKLKSIDARLAQHDKTARRGLIGLTAIGLMLLALAGYTITRL